MGANDKFIVRYSTGTGTNFGKAKNHSGSLSKFIEKFKNPTRTKERFKTYLKLSVDEQVDLKSIDGWYYRTQIEGKKRNAHSGKPSDMFTLDFDYAAEDFPDRLDLGLVCPGLEFIAHSTRRHTAEKPRLRVIGFVSRPVTNDEYGALSRIIAQMFDPEMTQVDKVSFRRAQMMFFPTCSVDSEYFFTRSEGALFDPDAILDRFTETVGDWRDITNLPRVEGEEVREHADKAEDPTTKKGVVGDFCRAYDVIEAIDHFELPYVPADDSSEKPRYTYTGGTTTSGAVVEDDGLFLFSHHGSDPCADMLVNAFDLVRIHKFGEKDEDVEKGTPINQWPSFKAMQEFVQDDPGYKRSQAKSKYDMQAMFDDVMDEYFVDDAEDDVVDDEEDLVGGAFVAEDDDFDADIAELVGSSGPKRESRASSDAGSLRKKRKKLPKMEDWFPGDLELDKGGNIVQNLPNAQIIIHNDPRLFGSTAFDEFEKRIVLRRSIMSGLPFVNPAFCEDKQRGDDWEDGHSLTVRAILAAPNGKGKRGYGLDKLSERDISGAIELVSKTNAFHPLKDYLEDCVAAYDGQSRIDTLFIDYLGLEDTAYARETARWVLVASVARIFEPGHKFDYAPVLQGPQGVRKSTFIEVLYGHAFFGELTCNMKDTQRIAETLGGKWGVELPELSAFYKSDHNDAKQFLSAKQDKVRMAYDRYTKIFKRQAIFWGTTNDRKYLKDDTGNRRWWPLLCRVLMIDTERLQTERDQIWGEAVSIYRAMRKTQPRGSLPLYLQSREADDIALSLQDGARSQQLSEVWSEEIQDWADTPVSLQQLRNEYGLGERMPDLSMEDDPSIVMVLRTVFRAKDAARGALGIDETIKNDQMTGNLDKALAKLSGWFVEGHVPGIDDPGRRPGPTRKFGVTGRWRVREGSSAEDIRQGYTVIAEDLDDLV